MPRRDPQLTIAALRRRNAELEAENAALAARLSETAAARAQFAPGPTALTMAQQLAVEAERARIALEIHDVVAQQLYGLVYALGACVRLLPDRPESVRDQLAALLPQAERASSGLRRAIFDLWPEELDAERFSNELQGYIAEIAPAANLQLFLQIDPAINRLPPLSRTQLYRIAQEALNNVLAHAHAQRAKVTLSVSNECVRLRIADNGCGFIPAVPPAHTAARQHFGLLSMRQRAALLGGHLELDSTPGQGTTVTVVVPLRSAA